MIAPARQVSFRILNQVAGGSAHSDDRLRAPEVDALSAQDRNLATTLVLGTLRWQLALDARIRPLLARPDAKLGTEAANALRLGAYQLLYLDRIPAHAAIHDSVELVKQSPERAASGMVNAVLRKIAGQTMAAVPERFGSPQELAAAFSHPAWMVGRWARRYGMKAAEAICRWDQEPAGVTLRISDPEDAPASELEPGAFLARARRVPRGAGSGSALARGRIQDEASQLVAEMAAAASPQAQRALDTCAAPGGKTAILAERLPAAQITALDVSRSRVRAAQAERFAASDRVKWEVADVARLRLAPGYGLILCDVPCSGTGTLARNPEIRLRLDASDLARQHARQAAILESSLAGLVAGGRLVYSTCSLEAEENEAVVAEVLTGQRNIRIVPVSGILDALAAAGIVTPAGRDALRTATDGNFLRTIPGVHPCDGFFAAVLERA